MDQKKLEERVGEIFEQQDFEVKSEGNKMKAKKDDEMYLKVFSSEKFSEEEVVEDSGEEKVFVDEGLSGLKDELENQVSVIREDEDEEYDLPSYELIGEIAVINELTVDEEEAVEGILEHHPSVKTILLKEEPLQGEYRVGEYRKLYGEETETAHTEFGCKFKVDPTKVYYSERFSTERKRVVDQIEDGEKVLVMFAGVGPFAIMAAKLANPEKVVAVEKNPEAAEYLKENIELNGVEDTVVGYEGDVREVVPELDEEFDRIIMPLPKKSDEFLDLSEKKVNHRGKIYLYTFRPDQISLDEKLSESQRIECGNYSPNKKRICIELVPYQ
jgi:tRNA (guanine37-N1)-methyltransferase